MRHKYTIFTSWWSVGENYLVIFSIAETIFSNLIFHISLSAALCISNAFSKDDRYSLWFLSWVARVFSTEEKDYFWFLSWLRIRTKRNPYLILNQRESPATRPESPGYPSGSYPELVECIRLLQMELRWQIRNPMVPAKMGHLSAQTWICLRSHQKFVETYFRDEIHDESCE